MTNRLITILLLLVGLSNVSIGQSNPHPCTVPNVTCTQGGGTGVVTSFGKIKQYTSPGRSMPFWVAIGDPQTGSIDTTVSTNITIQKVSGPGTITGTFSAILVKYVYFNDFKFSKVGTYKLEIIVPGYPKDTVQFEVLQEYDLCAEAPAKKCGKGGGNQLFAFAKNGNIIPVDAVFPTITGLLNKQTGELDTTFFDRIYVEKVNGPGNLYGTLSMHGTKWLSFNDLHFDAAGTYDIRFYCGSYIPDTLTVNVTASTVGIENKLNNEFNVYPNPFTNRFNVNFGENLVSGLVKVYDINGKLIHSQSVSSSIFEIDASFLNKGMYFVEVSNFETNTAKKGIVVKH